MTQAERVDAMIAREDAVFAAPPGIIESETLLRQAQERERAKAGISTWQQQREHFWREHKTELMILGAVLVLAVVLSSRRRR